MIKKTDKNLLKIDYDHTFMMKICITNITRMYDRIISFMSLDMGDHRLSSAVCLATVWTLSLIFLN